MADVEMMREIPAPGTNHEPAWPAFKTGDFSGAPFNATLTVWSSLRAVSLRAGSRAGRICSYLLWVPENRGSSAIEYGVHLMAVI